MPAPSARTDPYPSPFDASDYRQYLSQWYAWRCSCKGGYSLRRFAEDAGLGKSHAALRNVMKNEENLGGDRLKKFLEALHLSEEEEVFFRLLVARDQEDDHGQRARLAQEVHRARKLHDEGSAIDHAALLVHKKRAYVSRWYCSVLLDLARRPDFQADPRALLPHFGGRVSALELQQGLDLLVELGLLTPEGKRPPTLPDILLMPSEGAGEAALAWHRASHGLVGGLLAPEAHPEAPGSEFKERCRFVAATFLLRDEDRPALYKLLFDVQQQILARFDRPDGDQAVAVNLQLFSLTEVLPRLGTGGEPPR